MHICSLSDVFETTEVIFPRRQVILDDLVAFSNSESTYENPAFRARVARPDRIVAGRLPPRTTLHGERLFAANLGSSWISETIPHHLRGEGRFLPPLASTDSIPIEDECFIASRFGHGTWGHWLGEILPLVAVAEHVYPGRFRFATPFYGAETAWYGSKVVEGFAAYGIAENRLFRLSQGRSYVFSAAHWITPAWSDHVLHPDVATVMRGAVRIDKNYDCQRVRLLRRGARGRALIDAERIEKILDREGYVPVDIEDLSFGRQISVFRNASSVFSVLGSGLAGLIFSPDHVTVGTIRPRAWQDRFFTALMQMRRGKWADISGPTCGDNPMGDPFSIAEKDAEAALQALHMV